MNKIQTLDCTLRDGGYCNNWAFGFENIKKIISSLANADIEIIECGFLTRKTLPDKNITKYTNIEAVKSVLPENKDGKMFVLMLNYGEYDLEELPEYDGTSVDGIRVAFHKKDLQNALEVCKQIKEKGYKVFVQAMVSMNYTDSEFLSLIGQVNEIEPYAFYIVDSFGMMKKKNLMRFFYMVEHNLKENIWIGFHSHNNMQLAYSNAQSLVDIQTHRNLIIDSSVYGMGRGAGNLNTELFVEYLNENFEKDYKIAPLLNAIDEVLNRFYEKNKWGYSLPNYLSAYHNIHPNYANYLNDKNTLTVESMNEIFDMMEQCKKNEFDKEYIEKLYIQYMAVGEIQLQRREKLKEELEDQAVLLIAPGKSALEEKEVIKEYVLRHRPIVISVNFAYQYVVPDFLFVSNQRRFKNLDKSQKEKSIITSNIPDSNVYLKVPYYDLLNSGEFVKDNAGMMAIKLLTDFNVKKVVLAGFDGYSHDAQENFMSENMTFVTRNELFDSMNCGVNKILQEYKKKIEIEFLTKRKYI